MARIRSIKPEFPQSESVGRVSRDARLLFILLWTIADDVGRTRASSRMLASLLFPYDDDAPGLVGDWLDELDREGMVVLYEVDGSRYLQICKWLIHQKIDKPSPPKYPEFTEESRVFARIRESYPPDTDKERDTEKEKDKERPRPVAKPEPNIRTTAPDGVSESVWQDFKELRKRLKAPITQTALDGIAREAAKKRLSLEDALRMCCERSWRGFKADWVPDSELPPKNEPDPILEKLKHDAEKAIPIPENIKAKLGSLVEHLRMQ